MIEEYQKEIDEPHLLPYQEKKELKKVDPKEEITDAQNLAVNEILKIFIATLITLFKGQKQFFT